MQAFSPQTSYVARKPANKGASAAAKLRRILAAQVEMKHESAAALAEIERPVFSKWVSPSMAEDASKFPERLWVERFIVRLGYPSILVDWVFNGRDVPPPINIGERDWKPVSDTDVPAPVLDVKLGRFAEIRCFRPVGSSRWRKPSKEAPPITAEVPATMLREGMVGLKVGSMDDSLKGIAEQGQVLLVEPNEFPELGQLVMASKGPDVLVGVLRAGIEGYVYQLVNSGTYPQTTPAKGFDIYGVVTCVIRAVERDRVDIDYRPRGFRLS